MKATRFSRRRSAPSAGKALYGPDQEAARLRVTEEILVEVLSERRSRVSAARLLEKSRR